MNYCFRTNAFEMISVEGVSTGVIHCDDGHSLADWIRAITNNVNCLISNTVREFYLTILSLQTLTENILDKALCKNIFYKTMKISDRFVNKNRNIYIQIHVIY